MINLGSPWPPHPPPAFPMPWATHWGQDEYGLWCAFTLKAVIHRLRWIPPGEFWMGSPKDEAERESDEMRHRVVITQGYWLAETACDQALWQAVMGDNPSEFKGDERPVEKVSWEDVQQFCEQLNQVLPEFGARLPTEAEWEYACRAGTETAFWWGDTLSTTQANYDGNYPYDKGDKEEYREQTVAVKQFSANPWGLYQVHGNVWEWCEDWHGEYDVSENGSVDPLGPKRGSDRVLRGGCWANFGWWLRAACRISWPPGPRYLFLGFRLAAGPRPGEAR